MVKLIPLAAALLLALPGAAEPPPCPADTVRHDTGREGWCATSDGIRQGPFWARYPDGALRTQGVAVDDLPHGPWRSWHPDGAPSVEAHYERGLLSGPFRMWSPAGRLLYAGQHDAQGEMDGRFERWWPDGVRRMRWQMRAGVHHGVVEAWHPSGAPRLRGERREGLEHGEWTWWDEDGGVAHRCRYRAGRVVAGVCGAPGSAE